MELQEDELVGWKPLRKRLPSWVSYKALWSCAKSYCCYQTGENNKLLVWIAVWLLCMNVLVVDRFSRETQPQKQFAHEQAGTCDKVFQPANSSSCRSVPI